MNYIVKINGKNYRAIINNSISLLKIGKDPKLRTKNVIHLSKVGDFIKVSIVSLDHRRMPTYISISDVDKTTLRNKNLLTFHIPSDININGIRNKKKHTNGYWHYNAYREVYKFKIRKSQCNYFIPISDLKVTYGYLHNKKRGGANRRDFNLLVRVCKYISKEGKIVRLWYHTDGKNLTFSI